MSPRALLPLLGLLVGLVTIVAACGGSEASGPPEISYGRDVCDECHMIISEARFAASYRLDGETRKFDDIGDMVVYGLRNEELDDASAWVHDYDTEEWVEAVRATFVRARGLETPMAWGVVAYAEEADAEAFAADVGGEVMGWSELVRGVEDGSIAVGGHAEDAGAGSDSPGVPGDE